MNSDTARPRPTIESATLVLDSHLSFRRSFFTAAAVVGDFAAALKRASFASAHSGGGLSISPAERAKRKRREKIAKASRKRNRR